MMDASCRPACGARTTVMVVGSWRSTEPPAVAVVTKLGACASPAHDTDVDGSCMTGVWVTRSAVRLSRCLIHLYSMQELRGGSQCGIVCTDVHVHRGARKSCTKDHKTSSLGRLKVTEHNIPSTDGIRSLMTYSTASDNRVRGRSYLHDKRSLKHLHRGRSAVLGSHTATNRPGSPRGLIEHALMQCVPVLMYDGDSVQMMDPSVCR